MKRKVFLITGFQNWGKTYLIESMFNGRKRFYRNKLYTYSGKKFCVQSQSNDDFGKAGFERVILDRLSKLKDKGISPTHICAAFCPTKEPSNLSDEIIENLFHDDEVHIIAIEEKWCSHAQLNLEHIRSYYSQLKNVSVHALKGNDNKKDSLDALLQPLL